MRPVLNTSPENATTRRTHPRCGWLMVMVMIATVLVAPGALAKKKKPIAQKSQAASTTAKAATTPQSIGYLFSNEFEAPPPAKFDMDGAQPRPGEILSAQFAETIGVAFSYYGDRSDGVIRLLLDGTDVTDSANIYAFAINYSSPNVLSLGPHHVQLFIGEITTEWTFTVVPAPVVVSFHPSGDEDFRHDENLVVRALVRDENVDIDVGSVRLFLNGRNITDRIQVTGAGPREVEVAYLATEPLAPGQYDIRLEVRNQVNGLTHHYESFFVNEPPVYTISIESPAEGDRIEEPEVEVRVLVYSDESNEQSVSVNGIALKHVGARQNNDEIYSAKIPLSPGSNVLEAVVSFEDGQERRVSVTVTHPSAPVINITSPHDFEVFGPAVPSQSVQGSISSPTNAPLRSVAVRGSVDQDALEVFINGQSANLGADRRAFSMDAFFLHEGANSISVRAIGTE